MNDTDRHTIKAYSLRISDLLRKKLEDSAIESGKSLNLEITQRLEDSFGFDLTFKVKAKKSEQISMFVYMLGFVKGIEVLSTHSRTNKPIPTATILVKVKDYIDDEISLALEERAGVEITDVEYTNKAANYIYFQPPKTPQS